MRRAALPDHGRHALVERLCVLAETPPSLSGEASDPPRSPRVAAGNAPPSLIVLCGSTAFPPFVAILKIAVSFICQPSVSLMPPFVASAFFF